jgi:hypothetical protein
MYLQALKWDKSKSSFYNLFVNLLRNPLFFYSLSILPCFNSCNLFENFSNFFIRHFSPLAHISTEAHLSNRNPCSLLLRRTARI